MEPKPITSGTVKAGNYWDLLPFGWDDLYTTTHYYAALLAMAQLEAAAETAEYRIMNTESGSHKNPSKLDVPCSKFDIQSPVFLRSHAAKVKEVTNQKFWNEKAGRFVGLH